MKKTKILTILIITTITIIPIFATENIESIESIVYEREVNNDEDFIEEDKDLENIIDDDNIEMNIEYTNDYDVDDDYDHSYINYDDDEDIEIETAATRVSDFSITIPKKVIINGDKNSSDCGHGKYIVKVSGTLANGDSINIIPDESFLMHQESKGTILTTIEQEQTNFTKDDIDKEIEGDIFMQEFSAGSWNGTFNFNVELIKGENK